MLVLFLVLKIAASAFPLKQQPQALLYLPPEATKVP